MIRSGFPSENALVLRPPWEAGAPGPNCENQSAERPADGTLRALVRRRGVALQAADLCRSLLATAAVPVPCRAMARISSHGYHINVLGEVVQISPV